MINFLLVPLHTNFMKTGDYGIVVIFYSLSAMLMVLMSYRMETAFFRFGTEKSRRETVYSTALISIISSTIVFVSLMLLFKEQITVDWLGYSKDLSIITAMFALVLGLDTLTEIPFARLRQENRPIKFAAIRLTNIAVNVSLNLFFLVLCPWIIKQGIGTLGYELATKIYNPEKLVFYVVFANLCASLTSFLLLLPEILRANWKFNKTLWRKMFGYSSPLIIAGLAGIANEVLDRQLLKYLLPQNIAEQEIGIYGACYKLAMLMSLFTQAFRYAAEPFFFAQAKNKNSRKLYADVGKYFSIVGIFAFLFISFYIDYFQYFVGEEYRAGLSVVPILLIANLFLGMYYNLSTWYKLADKTKWGGYIMSVGMLITIVLNIIWIPQYGYIGSAWATLFCYATTTAISWYLGQKHYPIPYDLKRIFGYLALAIILYFISQQIENTGVSLAIKTIFNTILLSMFCIALYLGEKKVFKKSFEL